MPTYISARLDQDKPSPDPTFDGFLEIVHYQDRTRILGDLYHRVATDDGMVGILVYMAQSFQSRDALDSVFLDQAESKTVDSWSVIFHVSLEYKSGPVIRDMTGGLELIFQVMPGKTPRYHGFRIHT